MRNICVMFLVCFACTDDVNDYPVDPGGGQGFGSTTQSVTVQHAKQVAATQSSACALIDDGTVWCWGSNVVGQLGLGGSNFTSSLSPVQSTLTGVVLISGGGDTMCATQSSTPTEILCWGRDYFASLSGGPHATPYSIPLQAGLGTLTHLSVGREHACATFQASSSASTIWCWGQNSRGQLGDGTTTDSISTPVQIPPPSSSGESWMYAAVGGGIFGDDHTCATSVRDFDGVASFVYCTGSGLEGQNGKFPAGDLHGMAPMSRPGGRFPTGTIALGDRFSCSNWYNTGTSGATVTMCWGDHRLGHAGSPGSPGYEDGTNDTGTDPGPVSVPNPFLNNPALFGEATASFMCMQDLAFANGKCWGAGSRWQRGNNTMVAGGIVTPFYLDGRYLFRAFAVGGESAHALADVLSGGFTGYVYSWGRGSEGELGTGTTNDYGVPVWSHL